MKRTIKTIKPTKATHMGGSGTCRTCGKLIDYGTMYCASCRPK